MYEDQKLNLPLLIAEGAGPTLLGRNWLSSGLKLNWPNLHRVNIMKEPGIDFMLTEYSELFNYELGEIKDVTAKLYVNSDAVPKFLKARPVPYAHREAVNNELQRLENEGIIERVQH